MSLETRKNIIRKITSSQVRTVAIAMHNSPDGDAIGSAVALERMLLKLGKKVDIIIQNKISPNYSKIIGENRVNKIFLPREGKFYDLLILVDCADPERTIENVNRISRFIITIDHHYGVKPFGNIYLYERAASTGMIIYKIIKMCSNLDSDMATALYLTIRSDTSSFKNNNTDIKAHEVAGELLFNGANIQLINDIYDNRSLSFMRLMGYTFANIHYDKQYKIIYLIVKIEDIKKAQSNYEEASMLIDHIKGIDGAEVAFLFLEGNNNVRVKARSKFMNVSEIMGYFNGGGHPTAAGAQLYDDVYMVTESVIKHTKEHINIMNSERVKNDGRSMENPIKRGI